ncbi:MAG: hypothetical protein U1E41_03895 [Paracoccus sp. (in: a-proteobacteria)]|jgi:hypothetical protein
MLVMTPEAKAMLRKNRRRASDARRMTSKWQMQLRSRSGVTKVYAIKEDPRPTEGEGWLEFWAEG